MVNNNEITPKQAFLIERYKLLFAYTRQSMVGIWHLVGALTLIGSLLATVHKNFINFEIGFSLIFIVIFWAINVTVEYNQWHRRNLVFLTTIEREFLTSIDFGHILPSKYKTPPSKWISLYLLYMVVLLIILIFSIVIYVKTDKLTHPIQLLDKFSLLILFGGILITVWKIHREEVSIKDHIVEFQNKLNQIPPLISN